jgi:histidinol dehydrogenase
MTTKQRKLPVLEWTPGAASRTLDRFFSRPGIDAEAEATARPVLEDIQRRGDRAVAEYVAKFDGARIPPSRFRVTPEEMGQARAEVDRAFKRAAREADRRIARFSRAGMRSNWSIKTPRGGTLGERFQPLDRVGVYVPGGEAPLVSTALMTATLARVAGVPEIVACSPAGHDGRINPYILYALDLAGATEVYKLGGIQAIGAMAYGTRTMRPVRKIAGPGGPYVTAAKRLVYGTVDLDLVAGPSEVAILADGTAKPVHVMADLLSQLEHGTGHERALLVTTSGRLAQAVATRIFDEAKKLRRGPWLCEVLPRNLLVVRVRRAEHAVALSNAFAPEHLELLVDKPEKWVPKLKHAGAIFLGPWTPESAGDFAAGPSHVLPTGGTAATFAGLTVDAFRRRTSIIGLNRQDLEDVLPVIEAFGRVEELDGHARSARVRFTP